MPVGNRIFRSRERSVFLPPMNHHYSSFIISIARLIYHLNDDVIGTFIERYCCGPVSLITELGFYTVHRQALDTAVVIAGYTANEDGLGFLQRHGWRECDLGNRCSGICKRRDNKSPGYTADGESGFDIGL